MFILQSERIQTKNAVKQTFFKPKKDAFLYEKTRLQIRRKIKLNVVFCKVFVNSLLDQKSDNRKAFLVWILTLGKMNEY